jgi:hypothetical protein
MAATNLILHKCMCTIDVNAWCMVIPTKMYHTKVSRSPVLTFPLLPLLHFRHIAAIVSLHLQVKHLRLRFRVVLDQVVVQ